MVGSFGGVRGDLHRRVTSKTSHFVSRPRVATPLSSGSNLDSYLSYSCVHRYGPDYSFKVLKSSHFLCATSGARPDLRIARPYGHAPDAVSRAFLSGNVSPFGGSAVFPSKANASLWRTCESTKRAHEDGNEGCQAGMSLFFMEGAFSNSS